MATEPLYLKRQPGDLITAADWNNLQSKIRADIGTQIKEAIKNLTTVANSDNTHKIDNQTADELTKAILEKAKQELPLRTGYRRLFKSINFGEEVVIKHDLGACPLVDIYYLEEFRALCSEDDEKNMRDDTLFYLYHSTEKKLRLGSVNPAEIEPVGRAQFRIPFSEMLSLYKVSYTDSSSLGDLETEFWDAFLAAPNGEFDDDKYCHSPWFDRCCGEKRSVADLKQRGDWDELWFKVKPRKTINFVKSANDANLKPLVTPPPLQVVHFDLNSVGIGYPPRDETGKPPAPPSPPITSQPDRLFLMIILKV